MMRNGQHTHTKSFITRCFTSQNKLFSSSSSTRIRIPTVFILLLQFEWGVIHRDRERERENKKQVNIECVWRTREKKGLAKSIFFILAKKWWWWKKKTLRRKKKPNRFHIALVVIISGAFSLSFIHSLCVSNFVTLLWRYRINNTSHNCVNSVCQCSVCVVLR